MDRIREQVDALEPWQRTALMMLVGLVFLALVAVILVFAGGSPSSTATSMSTVSAETSTTTMPGSTTTTMPGSTTTTMPESTTTTMPESTTTTMPATLELRVDGLADATFGDPADTVEAQLIALLGQPDEDTGWVDKTESYATCIGEEVRFVRWGSLQVFFTDGPSDWAPAGVRHLASWSESVFLGEARIQALTPEGIGLGSTVDDVLGAYGDAARVEDDPLFGPSFMVDTTGAGFLLGYLTGLESTDIVQSLTAGFACAE